MSSAKRIVLDTSCYRLFPLESSWCQGPRTSAERKRNRETYWRQSKALKGVQREAKRKLVAQPEIMSRSRRGHSEAARSARTDEKFHGIIHVSHQLALLHGHENLFFCTQCGAVNASGPLRLLKSLCDGSGESRKKARRKLERGLMPNEHVVADAKRTFQVRAVFLDVAGCSDSPCIVNLIGHQKKKNRSRSCFCRVQPLPTLLRPSSRVCLAVCWCRVGVWAWTDLCFLRGRGHALLVFSLLHVLRHMAALSAMNGFLVAIAGIAPSLGAASFWRSRTLWRVTTVQWSVKLGWISSICLPWWTGASACFWFCGLWITLGFAKVWVCLETR